MSGTTSGKWAREIAEMLKRHGHLALLVGGCVRDILLGRPASDFDPAKIGLQPPRAVLGLDGEKLEFGESSVTGPQHYVRVGDRVALVSSRYMPRSPAVAVPDLP